MKDIVGGFEWVRFLDIAAELEQRDEEQCKRSAISRAYYAAYHLAKAWLDDDGVEIEKNKPVHKAVWEAFARVANERAREWLSQNDHDGAAWLDRQVKPTKSVWDRVKENDSAFLDTFAPWLELRIQQVGSTLKGQRHRADYSPDFHGCDKKAVQALIEARTVIDLVEKRRRVA